MTYTINKQAEEEAYETISEYEIDQILANDHELNEYLEGIE